MVSDLTAERVGGRMLLRWTTPSKTTDDLDVRGAMTAELCRETGPRPLTPAERLKACAVVRRIAVTPGASEVWDELPLSLRRDPPALLTYRIQIYNAAGRSAGDAPQAAYAAAGEAPQATESFRASVSEAGAVLEWKSPAATGTGGAPTANFVELRRVDLSPPPAAEKKPKTVKAPAPAKKSTGNNAAGKQTQSKAPKHDERQPDVARLRVTEGTGSAAGLSGTVDATAVMGDTYSYVAERVRTVATGSHKLEIRSEPSPLVTVAMKDTFPPKPPTGLATVPGEAAGAATPGSPAGAASAPPAAPYIDLSWEPNAEPDLAGYLVYRQLAAPDGTPQGPLVKLTGLPIAVPAYRDVAVRPGQVYIYCVTAVDASGNESAPSAKARDTVPPSAGESPQ